MNTQDNTARQIGAALKEYFDNRGIAQSEVADMLGVSQAAVSARYSGKKPFGTNAAKKWSDCFGFSRTWLRHGNGPMFEEVPDGPVTQNIGSNTGVAIQNIGNGSPINTMPAQPSSSDEGFFTRLCSQLMEQVMERDNIIRKLEEELRKLKCNE